MTSSATTRYSYRDIKNINVQQFRDFLLSMSSWTLPLSSSDPDSIVAQLSLDLSSALDKFAPLRTLYKNEAMGPAGNSLDDIRLCICQADPVPS